jgi:hypothetical protein
MSVLSIVRVRAGFNAFVNSVMRKAFLAKTITKQLRRDETVTLSMCDWNVRTRVWCLNRPLTSFSIASKQCAWSWDIHQMSGKACAMTDICDSVEAEVAWFGNKSSQLG